MHVSRADVLAWRWRAHGLDAAPHGRTGVGDVALLDLGVQDTGPDGAPWALALRGLDLDAPGTDGLWDDVALAWTLRGAPHAYRRADLAAVATATAPWSAADAAHRIVSAAPPLRDAGTDPLASLREVAVLERELVAGPTPKGDLSTRLTPRLRPEQVRWCGACGATHSYELPFRLAALQAGLELEPGTSPPVLRRAPALDPPLLRGAPPDGADPRFDVVRGYLRFFGPATVREAAEYVDAPPAEVRAHWPADAVEVVVDDAGRASGPASGRASGRGRPAARWLLADDVDALAGASAGEGPSPVVHLLGPFDPFLQLRDRATLVPDAAARKDLWRTLGRPGAVASGGEVLGTWRPRTSGRRLTVRVDAWAPLDDAAHDAVVAAAERLAGFRGVALAGVDGLG